MASRLRLRQGNSDMIFAYRTERPPNIDGNLDKWRSKPYSIQIPVFKPENWQGWRDMSGVFFITWDATNLYLGVKVTDDQQVQNESGRTMYKGDDVEVQVDAQLEIDFTTYPHQQRQPHLVGQSDSDGSGVRNKEATSTPHGGIYIRERS